MDTTVNDRIDIRISREQKELVQYASKLQGFKSVSEFVISCLSKAAREIVAENDRVLKNMEDKKIFVNALLNPPVPNTGLKKANLNYKKFTETNVPVNRNPGKKTQ